MNELQTTTEAKENCVPQQTPAPLAPWIRPVKRQGLRAAASRWRMLHRNASISAAEQEEILDDKAAADLVRYEHNIENCIGTVKVPVGVIGPLRIQGQNAAGDYYIPLATTEAALVASYGRGARLISAAGGCEAVMTAEGVQRAPVFVFGSIKIAASFATWIVGQFDQLKDVANATTSHGRLTKISPIIEGNHVYLFCSFTAGDAAGQNMVTFATNALCDAILRASPLKPEKWFLEGNLSGDKKASALSFQNVRGRRVTAAIELTDKDIRKYLHTSAKRMVDLWCVSALGGVMSGTIGVQAHYANGLAALYLATGQDVACVAESAVGVTRLELREDNRLFASVTLPNIMVGSVGGGTQLPSQLAALKIIGLNGVGCARALAEVCAALCLAGELSISGALCAGEFASAHHRLARGSK